MNNKKKILIGTGVAAAAVAGASYALVRFFLDTAFDREEPKLYGKVKSRLTGAYGEGEAYAEAKELMAELKARENEFERVEITARDGTPLVGHFRRHENEKRIIIAVHGWRSSWYQDFAGIAEFWNDCGSSVLYIEQRGQNASGGDYMGFGITERYDCLDWIDWVSQHNEANSPIYLAGVSMGAATVLMATGLDLPDCVHGVMADCGFTSPDDIWRHVANHNLHLGYGVIGAMARDITKRKLDVDIRECSTIDALKRNSTPVLLIHGTDDHFVPVTMTYENYSACAAPKRMLIVPGADHGMSYMVDKVGYENTVRKFFADFDDKVPVKIEFEPEVEIEEEEEEPGLHIDFEIKIERDSDRQDEEE